MFGKQKLSSQQVTNGRFEIEQDGYIAYLEYNLTEGILQLIHTEVPEPLRGKGLAATLAQSALEWAKENKKKIDVICPVVAGYLQKHLEYADLLIAKI